MKTSRRALAAVSAALVVIVATQAPGRIAPETKLDLAVNPVDFLRRALHLWEPRAAFGHVQNQAHGYLFPMGPFFAIGHGLHVPMWLVQRAWIAAILVTALVGTVRVADALGVGRPTARLAAGLAYALAPSMLTLVGFTSGGQLPTALLPWMLLPLIGPAAVARPTQAAARSGVALLFMGAVNATSTLAVLPLPLLYLATRRAPRRRLLVPWLAAVVLASAWWIGPLVLQSRYGLNFVPLTETARTTTATTSAFEILRGSGYWLAYLFRGGPWLPGGWLLVSSATAILAGGLVAAAGAGGLARRDMPERTFLVLAVVLGMAVITAGYGGTLAGPQATLVRHLLEGPLAAFRNVHKLEPVIRLPLALGLAHLVDALRLDSALARLRPMAPVAGAVAVVAAVAPALTGRLLVKGSFAAVPAHWQETASWLQQHAGTGRALLVPAAAFGEYDWGRPLDEPLQPLARTPWATRDLVPLGSAGMTSLVDAVQRSFDTGVSDPDVAPALARAGVRFVVVRNDLDPLRGVAPSPAYIHEAASATPGLRLVASFGPLVRGGVTTDRLVPRLAAAVDRYRAIEIYEVDGRPSALATYPSADVVALSGGPESLVAPGVSDRVAGRAVVATGDPLARPLASSSSVVSDGLRRRDIAYGDVRDNESYVLGPTEPAPGTNRPPNERTIVDSPSSETAARLSGIDRIVASSYGAPFLRLPERQPFAAFDGDPATAWTPGQYGPAEGEWVEADLAAPIDVSSVTIEPFHDPEVAGARIRSVEVRTATGRWRRQLAPTDHPQTLSVPNGRTDFVRITITKTDGSSVGFREIRIPGVNASRPLATPADAAGPGPIELDRSRRDPFDTSRQDEERSLDRVVHLPASMDAAVTATAVAVPGPSLDELMASTETGPLRASTTSVWGHLPAFRAASMLDGDGATAWVAEAGDPHPTVVLGWAGARPITGIHVETPKGPYMTPTRLKLDAPTGERIVDLDSDGNAAFPPLLTDALTITVDDATETEIAQRSHGILTGPPIAIAGLRLDGVDGPDQIRSSDAAVPSTCGSGPPITIDGVDHPTRVAGRMGDLVAMRPLPLLMCGDAIPLDAGDHRVTVATRGAFAAAHIELAPAAAPASPPTPARGARVIRWGATDRTVELGAGPASVLAVAENFNAGWSVTAGGHRLRPVRLAGWQQGFVVPSGQRIDVRLRFGPDATYRWMLAVGVALALLLVAAALWPRPSGTRPQPVEGASTATPAAVVPVAVLMTLAIAVAFMLSWPAVLATALLWVPARRWHPEAIVAGPVAVAAIAVALEPGRFPASHAGAFAPLQQVLVALSMAALILTLVRDAS